MYVCTSSVMICMEWMRVVWLCICVQVKNWMEQAIKTQLSATEKEKGRVYLPHVVRVAQQFKLTEVETEILYYSLIEQCLVDPAMVGKIAFGEEVKQVIFLLWGKERDTNRVLDDSWLLTLDSDDTPKWQKVSTC